MIIKGAQVKNTYWKIKNKEGEIIEADENESKVKV